MPKITLFVLLVGSLLSINVHATSFQLMPLDKLVEESSSAAEVVLKEKKSFMNKMGMILTDYIFTVGESYNLESGDLDGEFLKITMTGGTVNGVTSFIDGAPDFAIGEKSFLLLKKVESKIYISNFTMGKYKIHDEDGKTVYVSSVFPYDNDIGQVKKERMIDMLKMKYKITRVPDGEPNFKPAIEGKIARGLFTKEPNFEKRAPAQEDEDAKNGENGAMAMWAFFALFMTSGATIWWKLKKGVST
ncbi:MAG: hypothetical protein H7336_11105 [Bacteriovorax sp.]|nr:hypothetical protein [Bacteriovorax sp.]